VWKEIAWAEQKGKRVIPVLLEDVLNDDAFFGLHIYQAVLLHRGYADGLRLLLASLPPPVPASTAKPAPGWRGAEAKGIDLRPVARTEAELRAERRKLELEYLDSLRLRELLNAEKYTPLAGTSQVAGRLAMDWRSSARRPAARQSPTRRLEPVVMRPEFELLPRLPERGEMEEARLADVERAAPRRFENAVDELLRLRRSVVLGEPGAGKTTTLWALARQLVDQALADPRAPIPLLIRLGNWTQPGQPLDDFMAGELGELGGSLESLLAEGRAALLLDGLNETPAAQREAKSRELQAFVDRQAGLMAIVTCREQDYATDLGFDRVNILPLDPARIQEFVTRYLGQADGERLFWKLAGDERLEQVWETWRRAGASFELFWNAPDIPRENPNVYGSTSSADDDLWRRQVRQQGSLMALARNPYMLLMLAQVFVDQQGELPANRGRLFASFVDLLLAREHAASRDPRTRRIALTPEGEALLPALARLAYAMQTQRAAAEGKGGSGARGGARGGDGNALTALPAAQAGRILSERLLYLAGSASLLSVGDEVRFTHQLLQEYFAARHMQAEVEAGRLRAGELWEADRWW
jgi:predicted NACHT family NTPase